MRMFVSDLEKDPYLNEYQYWRVFFIEYFVKYFRPFYQCYHVRIGIVMMQKQVQFLIKYPGKHFCSDQYFVVVVQIVLNQNVTVPLFDQISSENIVPIIITVLFEIVVHFQIFL